MKKKLFILPLICLSGIALSSCNGSLSANDKATYERLLSFSTYTREVRRISIKKDSTTYYNAYKAITIDTKNSIRYENGYETYFGNIDEDDSSINNNYQIYKDGKKEYELRDDQFYYATDNTTKVELLSNPYDFTILRNGTYEDEGYNRTITKDLSSSDFKKFLKLENDVEYTSVQLIAEVDSETLRNINYTYTQNNYACTVSVEFTFLENTLTLPTNIAK